MSEIPATNRRRVQVRVGAGVQVHPRNRKKYHGIGKVQRSLDVCTRPCTLPTGGRQVVVVVVVDKPDWPKGAVGASLKEGGGGSRSHRHNLPLAAHMTP